MSSTENTTLNCDLSTLSGWSSVAVGSHTLKIKARAEDHFPSDLSTAVNFTIYSITTNLTNVSAASTNKSKIINNSSIQLTFTADTGYNLPETVTVSGATSTWNKNTGILTLSNPTENVSITISGLIIYSVTGTATNATIEGLTSYTGTIIQGSSLLLNLAANGTTYKLPTSVTVSGATATYSRTSDTVGTLTLSNPTGNVSVTVTALQVFSITATTTNVTASASNPSTITSGSSVTLTFTADGTSYKVPTSMPTITGATGAYNRVSDTECMITLSNATGNVSFSVAGEEVSSYDYTQSGSELTLRNASYTQSGSELQIN